MSFLKYRDRSDGATVMAIRLNEENMVHLLRSSAEEDMERFKHKRWMVTGSGAIYRLFDDDEFHDQFSQMTSEEEINERFGDIFLKAEIEEKDAEISNLRSELRQSQAELANRKKTVATLERSNKLLIDALHELKAIKGDTI